MVLFFTSFIAGFLTILAPCVLPLLPITLGGAVADSRNKHRPLIIIASLSVSVFLFTLLLKGSTALLDVSPSVWTYVSAIILGIYGLSLVFPYTWAKLMLKMPGHRTGEASVSDSRSSAIVVGLALGPVFTTCSPTFFLILATVLPQSFSTGIVYLLAYVVGLAVALLLVSWIGQRLVTKLEWTINPVGWFRRSLGILFVVIAVLIGFGLDKQIESGILTAGFFDVTKLEQKFRQIFESTPIPVMLEETDTVPSTQGNTCTTTACINGTSATTTPAATAGNQAETYIDAKIPGELKGGRYTEIVNPAGFVNTGGVPIKLADFIGKKVLLVDFIDYSCINCQRTFPYMKDWWSKYKDQGLEIIAFHTPEFAFERKKENVEAAAKEFGLTFPIVLDNSYDTWNAYQNQYWPHKYIIDINGNVVYDHIGEGAYDNTEKEIVKQLNIRKQKLGESGSVVRGANPMPGTYAVQAASPETYFGASRNHNFGNGTSGRQGQGTFEIPVILDQNEFYLGGSWNITTEYAENTTASSSIAFRFSAAKMYLVAEAADGKVHKARILLDGVPISASVAGDDVKDGILTVNGSRLYSLFKNQLPGQHRIDIIWMTTGVRMYTFTFG